MPVLKDKQQEKFAVELAKGENQTVAYENAGYKRHAGNAARLAARQDVIARVTELRERASRRSEITVQRVVENIGDIAFADDGSISTRDRLRGLELLGRYLSIFQDNLNVNTSSDLAERMRQAQARMRAKRAEREPLTIEGIATAAE